MNDVFAQIVIAIRDEYLGSTQQVGIVRLDDCNRANQTKITAGLRLGKAHGAKPFTTG
ncbi:hypothetical protein D3C72_1671510 [compost metagenome]